MRSPHVKDLGVFVTLIFALSGCQREARLYPTSGVVRFADGQPVAGGTVEFMPSDGGPSARSMINPDGTFQLRTGDRMGAAPGRYRVVVLQVAVSDGYHKHVHRHLGTRFVHAKHRRFDTSEIECLGEPSETKHIDIVVAADR